MAILAILALVLAACGGGGTGEDATTTTGGAVTETTAAEAATTTAAAEEPAEEVTIEWWHIQNTDPMMTLWQDMANEFMEANPNVTDQHHSDGERGVQGGASNQSPGR